MVVYIVTLAAHYDLNARLFFVYSFIYLFLTMGFISLHLVESLFELHINSYVKIVPTIHNTNICVDLGDLRK